jgi:NADPH:quinone reductase-like Zn-dependent oxidoreductase
MPEPPQRLSSARVFANPSAEAQGILSGQLDVEISSRLPLSGAAEAHTILEGRRATGKIVLKPWPAK